MPPDRLVASRTRRQAIRDAESRTRFLGYRVESYKLWVFVFSAIIAGVAGALYVPQVGIINPSEFAPINSIEVVIWVAVGGRGTLYGAAAGAVLVNYAKTFLTGALPEVWLYALGALFVLVTDLPAARTHGSHPGGESQMSAPDIPAVKTPAPPDIVRQSRRWTARAPLPDRLLNKVLYLNNVTVSFDGFKALDALTLDVEPGELRCIIGPNGAGKTTMMDVITGKTRPDHGTAWFGPQIDLLALTEPEIAQAGIGRKFQKPSVFEHLTVFENLELSLAGDKSFWKNLVARLTPGQRDQIDRVLGVIGLAPERVALASTLSHGQKQWLEIGMLLMQEPELLLVDEPVAGMTPQETERTAELLLSLAGEALGDRRGARHGLRALDRERSPCCTKGACSRKATWTTCRTIRASSRCTSEHERAHAEKPSTSPTAAATPCGTSTWWCRRDRAPASWAATAWARPRC